MYTCEFEFKDMCLQAYAISWFSGIAAKSSIVGPEEGRGQGKPGFIR